MGEVLQAWQSAIPEELASLLLEVFDLPAPAKEGASIDTQRRASLESGRGGAESSSTAYGKAGHGARKATGPKGDKPRKVLPAEVFDEDDRAADEDEEEDDEPHVLDSGGIATPWRTLGSLAQKAAYSATAGDEEDEESEEQPATEVVRKAHEELKDARTRRLSVMKFVEEAATPKPRRTRSAVTRAPEQASKPAKLKVAAAALPRPKQQPLDESHISLESTSLPTSPRAGDRRVTRAAAAVHVRQPLSDRSEDRPRVKPARAGSRPSSARSSDRGPPQPKERPAAAERRQAARAKARA